MRIELYQDTSGAWRWRAMTGGGRIFCEGTESTATRDGIELVVSDVMTDFRADVQVIYRDQRRHSRVVPAPAGKPRPLPDVQVVDRRGLETPSWVEIATYEAEGAKPKK